MDIIESIKISLDGLRSNKMRSLLTMLGIIIGIAAVIGIITIGDTITVYVNTQFDSFGSTAINYEVTSKNNDIAASYQESDLISETMMENIETKFSNRISSITTYKDFFGGTIKDGRNYSPVYVLPSTEGMKDVMGVKMESGRFLNEDDYDKNRKVGVISSEVVKEIFNGDNNLALGSEIDIDTINYGLVSATVIGIYKHETNIQSTMMSMMGSSDKVQTYLYIPLSTGVRITVPEMEGYTEIYVVANNVDDVKSLTKDINDYLNNTYYSDNDYFEISAVSVESMVETINAVLGTIQLAMGAIAAISLIVGGIGVMNILLVSVTERTSEIGVRKAMGATNNNIRMQFIVESIILCILGGIVGIILGGTIGYVASSFVGITMYPSSQAIMIAVGFSTFIGIFFGYYPANKAAVLNPIDALRYE